MKPSPLPPLIVALAIAGAALSAGGCGATTTVGGSRTLRVGLSEYRVTPERAQAGAGLLMIVAHNYGRLTHNLVVSLNGVTEASTEPIAPGQTAQLETVLSPGRYQLASTELADQALGAYGTLQVSR